MTTVWGLIEGKQAIRMIPKIEMSIPIQNHPKPLRPFELAMIAQTMAAITREKEILHPPLRIC